MGRVGTLPGGLAAGQSLSDVCRDRRAALGAHRHAAVNPAEVASQLVGAANLTGDVEGSLGGAAEAALVQGGNEVVGAESAGPSAAHCLPPGTLAPMP